jgi:CRISPR/Cas system-associated protein Csm6
LARQKELNVKRERETAELVEKERQMSVRLRQSQVEVKKAREDIRQLTSDADLKQNQFQHALKRRDLENHRLNEQLIKLIRSKPVRSGGGANVPLEFEIRGSLTAAPPLAGSSPRRKWDKAEDVRK